MEELSVVGLSQRKESTIRLTTDLSPLRPNAEDSDIRIPFNTYPFALVLRLRVLQIVCGISALVMGSVAFIEERRETNLGLGIPAGGATVLAAAASIHTWRGGRLARPGGGGGRWGAAARALGPAPLAALWAAACACHTALLVQSLRTILQRAGSSISDEDLDDQDPDKYQQPSSRDLTVLACVQIVLTCTTLACQAALLNIDWRAATA